MLPFEKLSWRPCKVLKKKKKFPKIVNSLRETECSLLNKSPCILAILFFFNKALRKLKSNNYKRSIRESACTPIHIYKCIYRTRSLVDLSFVTGGNHRVENSSFHTRTTRWCCTLFTFLTNQWINYCDRRIRINISNPSRATDEISLNFLGTCTDVEFLELSFFYQYMHIFLYPEKVWRKYTRPEKFNSDSIYTPSSLFFPYEN